MNESLTCFKAYDIRGQIPNELNAEVCYRIGNATGEFLKAKTMVVGRDMRLTSLEFADNNITSKRWSLFGRLADNSDGRSNLLSLTRPFVALDTRWTAGTTLLDDVRNTQLYRLGDAAAEFSHDRDYYTLFGGGSKGRVGRWIRRYTGGVVYDDNRFSEVSGSSLETAIPADRKLVYPFVGIEILEDDFETGNNRNQIGKTEDFYLGQHEVTNAEYAEALQWAYDHGYVTATTSCVAAAWATVVNAAS